MDMQLDPPSDLQRLLERQGEIQRAMRGPGGIRITVERELYAIDEQLKKYRRVLAQGAGGLGAHTPHTPQS